MIDGKKVYNCNYANHCVNIKNLLEYNPSYANCIATNEFYFLDTTRAADRFKFSTRQVQHARSNQNDGWVEKYFMELENMAYNDGFYKRKNYR